LQRQAYGSWKSGHSPLESEPADFGLVAPRSVKHSGVQMAGLVYFFNVAIYRGPDRTPAFDPPVRTIAAHPIAAAERVTRTKLYLLGEPQNLFAEVSYVDPDGVEERLFLYHGMADQSPPQPIAR